MSCGSSSRASPSYSRPDCANSRNSPMSPGIPPGNSKTTAAPSWTPCAFRSRSTPVIESRSPRCATSSANWARPELTARQHRCTAGFGKRSSMNPFRRVLPPGALRATDSASFRRRYGDRSASATREVAAPRQIGAALRSAEPAAFVIRHYLRENPPPLAPFRRIPRRLGRPGMFRSVPSMQKPPLDLGNSIARIPPLRPPLPFGYNLVSASARTRSARLTMPTTRPSRNTGTRLMRCAVSSRATSSISVSSPTVITGAVMTSRARRSGE